MDSIVGSMIATAGLIISGFALAVGMPAEGKAKCGTCHAIDKNIFGPSLYGSFREIQG